MLCETCGKDYKEGVGIRMHRLAHERARKATESATITSESGLPNVEKTSGETIAKGSTEIDFLKSELAELRKKDEENQKKLQMLYDVADKGRLFNWEARQKKDKKPQKVKLTAYKDGLIVGWRTIKDELIQDPRTGRTIGENQQYEVLVLGKDGKTMAHAINGYVNFSNVRYENRVECEVLSRSEDFEGKITYEVGLPDGRRVTLGAQFVN